MSAPPTRCCSPATKGRCSNAPAPYGQSRYIGTVEIAACNHPKHQAALRSLPDFQRRAGVCGADDCGKPAESGLCPEHRQLYRRHGVNIRALLAQEAPMTEPTPEAQEAQTPPPAEAKPALAPDQTREVQVWRGQDWVDCEFSALKAGDLARMREDSASEWGFDTFRTTSDAYLHPTPKGLVWTVDAVPMPPVVLIPEVPDAVAPTPPAAPQEAADGGATPSTHPIEARRDRLVATLLGAGFEEKPAISGRVRRFAYCNDYWVIVPNGPAAESQEDFARALDTAEAALKRLTSTVDAPHLPVVPAPADDGEPSEGDVDDAPLFVGGTDSAPVQPMSPDLAALATDPMQRRRDAVVARLLALGFAEHEGTDTLRMFLGHGWSVPIPLPGHDARPRKVEDMIDDAERLCRRLEKKAEPPAPGPTLAEVQAELAAVTVERDRLRADLAAIAEALDPEDAPAYDSDDQPIPLPVRVQVALMPDTAYERELRKSLHAVEAELFEVDRTLQHLGAYGNGPTIDRLLKVLTPEDRRNVLEVQAAEARMDLARLKARRLNPPPPGRLEEYAAKVAEIEAKIAALDAGEGQK